jgi:hypothetical protein
MKALIIFAIVTSLLLQELKYPHFDMPHTPPEFVKIQPKPPIIHTFRADLKLSAVFDAKVSGPA